MRTKPLIRLILKRPLRARTSSSSHIPADTDTISAAGLVAVQTIGTAQPPRMVDDAVPIAVPTSPNRSITGSPAIILRLQAIRREGEDVRPFDFLKLGTV